MVVSTCPPPKVEAGGLGVQDHPQLHTEFEILSQNKQNFNRVVKTTNRAWDAAVEVQAPPSPAPQLSEPFPSINQRPSYYFARGETEVQRLKQQPGAKFSAVLLLPL